MKLTERQINEMMVKIAIKNNQAIKDKLEKLNKDTKLLTDSYFYANLIALIPKELRNELYIIEPDHEHIRQAIIRMKLKRKIVNTQTLRDRIIEKSPTAQTMKELLNCFNQYF